ncbi:hypothetical protein ACQ4LE_004068 [Meloidogyne hapla]
MNWPSIQFERCAVASSFTTIIGNFGTNINSAQYSRVCIFTIPSDGNPILFGFGIVLQIVQMFSYYDFITALHFLNDTNICVFTRQKAMQGRLPPLRNHSKAFEENIQQTGQGDQKNIVGTNEDNSAAIVLEPDKSTITRPKFKTIAKGLSLMSRVRVADAAMNREQQAFFSKYGISTSDGVVQNQLEEKQNTYSNRGWLCFKNIDLNGVSLFEYVRHRLVFDPYRDYYYYWLGIVTLAYGYNLMLIVYRSVFIDSEVVGYLWVGIFILLDILTDIIYLLDCFVRSRTGYLDQGLLVRDVQKVLKRYKKDKFLRWIDLIACLPLDYLFESGLQTTNPGLRFNRLIRLDRVSKFANTTEMRVSKPNLYRIFCVCLYILILIHWNACFYYFISGVLGINSNRWVYGKANLQAIPDGIEDTLSRRYLYSCYWSTLMLSNVCEVPWPIRSTEFIIVCADLMFGVLIFATIVGNVGSMIAASEAARSNFQSRIDNVKCFLRQRNVNKNLLQRISNWFDYIWQQNKQAIMDGQDDQVLSVLPTKLQAEIAMHVHFETLRKVRLFQDCEAGLLGELVLKLQLQVFSPGDFVCRKGDVGREMYIVKKGRLQVVSDDGIKVFHTLLEGAVFGELSLLNIPGSKHGNRRSASIRSVGYTDLFVLKKADLWEALREYPEAKRMLVHKGREILLKDGLLNEDAPLEEKSAEQWAQELKEQIDHLLDKLSRLTAEYISNETKLLARISFLEKKLQKYDYIISSSSDDEDGL